MDNIALRRRIQARQSERTNIEGVWELIERFIIPLKASFFNKKNSEGNVDWTRREIYDSTAILANQNLAANIHSALTNPVIRWFNYRFKQEALNQLQPAKVWLQECEQEVYNTVQESNFNLEVNETYVDLTGFGTSVLALEAKEGAMGELQELTFSSLLLDECFFDEDADGNLINFYRVLEWDAIQLVEKFGLDGVPVRIEELYHNPDRAKERHTVAYCVYKRPDKQNTDTFTVTEALNRPYGSKYFLYDTGENVGNEGGYYEMPVFIPRWRKASGSKWGFSPGMIAIWDVLTLNQLKELILVAGEKVVDPPILTTRKGVFGDIDLQAAGVTTVASLDAIAPFESKARFDVSQIQVEDLKRAIQQVFFVDQLQLKESPAMTATEVRARVQLMQRLLGPTFGRLHSDLLSPMIERVFMILYRYRMLPDLPKELQGMAADLDIEYTGPLAKAQRLDTASSIERWLGNVTSLQEIFPEAKDVVNIEESLREMSVIEGVPAKLVNSRKKVKSLQDKREQERKQQQQVEQDNMNSDTVKNLEGGASHDGQQLPA